jgi:hypothetical protein
MKKHAVRIKAFLTRSFNTVYDYAFPTMSIAKPKPDESDAPMAAAAAPSTGKRNRLVDDEAEGDEDDDDLPPLVAAKPTVAVPGESIYASLGSPTGATQALNALGFGEWLRTGVGKPSLTLLCFSAEPPAAAAAAPAPAPPKTRDALIREWSRTRSS